MATTSDLLLDLLSRVRENVHSVLESTPGDRLANPPAPGTNTITWLVWHLTRVLDEQVADVFGYPAVWEAGGWRERLALPVPPDAHGYGMAFEEVLQVRASAEHLRGYFDAASAAVEEAFRGSHRRRPRPGRRRELGPAGDAGGAAGQRPRRLRPARRAGGLRQRHPQPFGLSCTTTGAWSLAPVPLRSSRSMTAPATRAASEGEPSTKSMRMPRRFWKASRW